MKLGNFYPALAVKDLQASIAFYKKLGFSPMGGDENSGWQIMQNGDTTIGLYQGMFESNILTFNPGWDNKAQTLEEFDDVRDIQKSLKSDGVTIDVEADESTSGPAHIILTDPDGNTIMLDQHV